MTAVTPAAPGQAVTTLDRAGIAARIPHAGSMCLLHALLDWSATTIACSAVSHRDADNPLRDAHGLPAAAAIEYAAQAMALHGALSPRPARRRRRMLVACATSASAWAQLALAGAARVG